VRADVRAIVLALPLVFAVLNLSYGDAAGDERAKNLAFDNAGNAAWKRVDFSGHNEMEVAAQVLKVSSNHSASAYYYAFKEPVSAPFSLSWSWKVSRLLTTGDPLLKRNDDYAARVYVVFRVGPLPWQIRSLNYVWTDHVAGRNGYWLNPYSRRSAMLPLNDSLVRGRWQQHRVYPVADLQRIFGAHRAKLVAIAVMTDTDDSGQSVQASYKDLRYALNALPSAHSPRSQAATHVLQP